MAISKLTDEQLLETIEAVNQTGNNKEAAERLGINYRTISDRLRVARERGLYLSQGARNAMANAGLSGIEARGGWIHNYDDEGKKTGTTRWTAPEVETADFIDRFREMLEGIKPAKPVPVPDVTQADSLVFVPDADVHVGLVVTEDETGHEPYNREIAKQRFMAGTSRCIMSLPPSHTCLIASMGDLTHANDPRNITPRSGHTLRVEGTHHDNLFLSAELLFYKVDLALTRHRNVEVEVIGGNHDPGTPGPILLALQQRYRNDERVKVNVSQNEWWHRNWGEAFMCGQHGHYRNAKAVCATIPAKFRRQWGEASQWHFFSAHYHSYKVSQEGSVLHHQLPAVCALDTHAAWSPYMGNSGMVALQFDKKTGMRDMIMVGL